MSNINYIIKNSPIHGQGLFITENTPIHTPICYYTGTEMTRKDFKEKYGKDITYCYYCSFPWLPVIVSKEERNPITFCNESNNPNCYLKKRWLYSNRSLKAGEELTLKYNKTYPRVYTL